MFVWFLDNLQRAKKEITFSRSRNVKNTPAQVENVHLITNFVSVVAKIGKGQDTYISKSGFPYSKFHFKRNLCVVMNGNILPVCHLCYPKSSL